MTNFLHTFSLIIFKYLHLPLAETTCHSHEITNTKPQPPNEFPMYRIKPRPHLISLKKQIIVKIGKKTFVYVDFK